MSSASRTATAAPDRGSTVYVALGTNIGDRGAHLQRARAEIEAVAQVEAASAVYETDPVGFADQPRFWNMVLRARTKLPPAALLAQLLAIEERMGRQRDFRNAPRIIDLDILLYDDVVLDVAGLTIPHPRMTERAFVLKPLLELAPELTHPITGERFADILQRGTFEHAEKKND